MDEYSLVDDTSVSIPMTGHYAMADGSSRDAAYSMENKGVAPDVEVDITPGDYIRGEDSQLLKAIEVAMDKLALGEGRDVPSQDQLADRPATVHTAVV